MEKFKGRGIPKQACTPPRPPSYDEGECMIPKAHTRNKFAPVAPHHLYSAFLANNYVPHSILLLAHDVVAHPDEYSELFISTEWSNTTIFMDNSLVELKKAVDIEMVADAVDIVGRPQVVVICPDVMAEAQASAKLTKDAWPEWYWRFRHHQKLVVLQGSDMAGFLGCAESLAELEPDWVSIPRVTESLWGYHRAELIPYVDAIFPTSRLHLLGFSDYIWEDLRAASHWKVASIDSAVPLRMKTPLILTEDVGKRDPQWFENVQFEYSMIDRCNQIDAFINRMKVA